MKSLREIFWSLPKFADKWDPYFDVYETWFSKFRGTAPRVLEIGVQHGGSSLMWLEYFGPGAKVIGVDINPLCAQHAGTDVDIVIGDQSSPVFWEEFFNTYPDKFDIVIDDGSHQMTDMALTFSIASRYVKENGIYLIEDCHTAYWTDPSIYYGDVSTRGLNNPANIIEFTKRGLDALNNEHMKNYPHVPQLDSATSQLFNHIKSVHYYNSIVVYEVGTQKPFTRCLNNGTKMKDTQ